MTTAVRTRERPAARRSRRKRTLVAYSFLAPNFLGFAIFTLVPVLLAVALSFFEWNGGDISRIRFVGFDNYANIFNVSKVAEKGIGYFFNRVDLGIALKNTVFYTAVTVPLTIACALALALAWLAAVRFALSPRLTSLPKRATV